MIYNCSKCNKEFYFEGDIYTYKKSFDHKVLNFCGWNCMRKFEREKEVEQWMKN